MCSNAFRGRLWLSREVALLLTFRGASSCSCRPALHSLAAAADRTWSQSVLSKVPLLTLFSKLHHADAAGADDLSIQGGGGHKPVSVLGSRFSGHTILVDLAQACGNSIAPAKEQTTSAHQDVSCPLTEALVVRDVNDRHVLLHAQALAKANRRHLPLQDLSGERPG